MEEANKLIGTGKKHLVMGKVVEAVGALQEACGMLAKKYGDTADECGEAFFWCGKALLDLARMENTVLGNALEGVPEEEDEDKPKDSNVESADNIDEKTRDELRVQVYDAMAEKKDQDAEKVEGKPSKGAEEMEEKTSGDAEVEEKPSSNAEGAEGKPSRDAEEVEGKPGGGEEQVEGKPNEDKEKNDVEKTEAADEQQKTKEEGDEQEKSTKEERDEKTSEVDESKSDDKEEESADKPEEAEDDDEEEEEEDGDDAEMETEEQGGGDGTAEKDSDDEEVGNLQLAWEMLEVAKVIYKRKETKEDQLMAAQAHLKLGEVSAESGNYTQALEDFQECLKLQQQHLNSDSRLLAETYYQLGLTYSLNLEYSKAIEELNNSISVIKSRLDNLQELLDKADGPDALPDERKEMEELKALLPEIQEKVEDAAEGLKMASTAVKDVLDGGSTSSVQNGDSSSLNTNCTTTNGVCTTNGQASTAPVSDISHLVRKKRKPEESPVKEGAVKKVKQDETQTDEVQEPHTNGIDKANSDTKSVEVESQ